MAEISANTIGRPKVVVEWQGSPAIPRGGCVILAAGRVVWMGAARDIPAEPWPWPDPVTVNVDMDTYQAVYAKAKEREPGAPRVQ